METRDFHPGYSLVDSARTYMICGGVPMYLEQFDAGRSFEVNIRECLLDEFAPLFREPEFLLRKELREIANYALILMTLSVGSLPGKDIASRTGIDQRKLSYYLGQLHDLGFVRKRYPLTVQPPSGRKVRYAISDPLLRFRFRFVQRRCLQEGRQGVPAAYRGSHISGDHGKGGLLLFHRRDCRRMISAASPRSGYVQRSRPSLIASAVTSGLCHRRPGNRPKAVSAVQNRHPCSMASAAR